MLVIPEFASFAKLYRPSVRRAVLRRICAVIRKNMPASVVAAHTGRATFVLFLKNQSVGTMRRFIEQIRTDLTTITEVDGFACHFSMRYALESGTEARTSDEFLKILSSRCLDYLPSYGVTGMIGDQVPFDIEKFDHVNRLIYIADAETYDLLYVNPCLLHYRHLPVDYQYAGQKCYQLFNGTSSPCTSCPKDNLRRDRFHFRTFHSLRNSKDYHIWSTLVSWNNHSCIFTDALDVERMMHAEDYAPLRQCLQHTTILKNKPFYDAFHRSSVLLIDNAAAYQERHPELQIIPQGILERYAIGQLMIEHRSLGYIAIIDPTKEGFAAIAKPLHTILRITSIMMRNRNNIQKLHEISTIDQLTGIGNRRALSNFVDKCLQPGTMYAVIFIDVNGLKKMNDTFGHARGDLLIQTIAYVLSNVAGKNHVFRLGGDEFLVLMPCSSDEEAITIIDRMEQSMTTHHCSAAIGYVLCLAPFHDLEGIIHQADEKMYSDKKRKHMRRDDD
ncbi:diguanylate cyclase domain-containing protein [Mitsuokella multacida]|uniref:diguanylate cyclase domain-containing protein n=1 Tax=Mitsuokella multacida TaxID=52226 RepID=UPI0026E0A98D|nr:diguanylate cyclase [Mitsuokella multacida]